MKQCKAVIFDMDGVIVDSEPRHERAFLEVVREIGYGDNHDFRFADYVGRSDKELWVDFVAKHNPQQTQGESARAWARTLSVNNATNSLP